jgi:hypothetical protein
MGRVSEAILRKIWFVALAITAALLPVRADASELQLQFTGMGLSEVVTIGGSSGVSVSFFAGEINWLANVDGVETSLYTYCVDILNDVASPQTVRVSDTADALMTTRADNGAAKAAWLLNTYAETIHAAGSGLEAAALQVAIWEALSDNDRNLADGYFTLLTGGDLAVKANDYLDALFSVNGDINSVATWLDAVGPNGGQDQIATPEPSSLVLLGVAGMLVRRRRRLAA